MKESSQESSQLSDSDFMRTFLEKNRPPQESIEYFKSVPWLNKYMSSGLYNPVPTFSRHLKSSGEDYFFSRTINTETTIPHFISLQLKDFHTPEPITDHSPNITVPQASTHKSVTPVPDNPDALMLLRLGGPGIDGHPATTHGGVTCAILDETMGLLVMLHDNNIRGPGPRDSLYTANLNVSYRAPIPTPGDVLVKTWLVKRQGRKWYSRGQIVDKDGKILAEAEGLWVVVVKSKI